MLYQLHILTKDFEWQSSLDIAIIIRSSLHHSTSKVTINNIPGMHCPVPRKCQNAETLAASGAFHSQLRDSFLECKISLHSCTSLYLLLFQVRVSTSLFCFSQLYFAT